MLLMNLRSAAIRRAMVALMFACLGLIGILPAAAQIAAGSTSSGTSSAGTTTGVAWKICKPPPFCFATREAKEAYAKENNCKFLEDVCSGTPPKDDNHGANPEDQGFWGSLWSTVKDGLVYGYEFVKGLLTGLKEQVTDLVELVGNLDVAIGGLVDLGKAFYNDPKGTLVMLAELLGQEVVDTITKATQCGAYDLGKVIGGYVDPVVMIKLATKLTKYSGKLSEAVKATKVEYGCASFAAGTLVLTPQGYMPIEQVAIGQQVSSRNERSYADAAQAVTQVFGRVAPSFRLLRTESDTYKLTDEHPLWVQGKGWTEVKNVTDDDIIAGQNGDTRVLSNEVVRQPIRVYNFSVAQTPSYFVGKGAIWAHNAACRVNLYTLAWEHLTPKEKGFRAESDIFYHLTDSDKYKPVGNSFNPTKHGGSDKAFKAWDGQTGIDGIYVDAKGNYVIVESKATGGLKASDPSDCVMELCKMKTGERQMSKEWIKDRLEKIVSEPELSQIVEGLDKNNGKVKRVYAQTDEAGTTYHEVVDVGSEGKDVKIGGVIKL
jgi:hypothetical protein